MLIHKIILAGWVAASISPDFGTNRDTYGLPPFTPVELEWKFDKANVEGPGVVCARTKKEWAVVWDRYAPKGDTLPEVDFERLMVVGIVGGKADPSRAVYRIELDDAVNPSLLMVRCSEHSANSLKPKVTTIIGAKLHLVATARSALPVRFVIDSMVDGRLFSLAGGVDETPLGTVEGFSIPTKAEGVLFREEAEKRVRASLKDAEVTELKKELRHLAFGDRYPQLWSCVSVRRGKTSWTIEYDRVKFEVDVLSGQVRRL